MPEITTYQRWMVYGVGQRAPTYEHTSEDRAREEAQRLARDHPGITFYVLKAVHGYLLAPMPITDVIIDPEEIPF